MKTESAFALKPFRCSADPLFRLKISPAKFIITLSGKTQPDKLHLAGARPEPNITVVR